METTMYRYIQSMRCTAFLLVLIVSFPLAVAVPKSGNKPNIILVVMDNFGYGEIGVWETTKAVTPQTRTSMSGMESLIHQTKPSGPIAIAFGRMQASNSPTS
jgi:hypothetical protein